MDVRCYGPTQPMPTDPDQIVWITSGDSPDLVTATRVAERSNWVMRQPHYVWNPATGTVVRMIDPAKQQNRMFPQDHPGAAMVAVLVVAKANPVFTDYPKDLRQPLFKRLADLEVPPTFPLGPPVAYTSKIPKVLPPGHYFANQLGHSSPYAGPVDTHQITGALK